MDENKQEEKQEHPTNHHLMKQLLIGILVFLGAFCAFYTVADWHMKRLYNPIYQMKQMDRMMMQQEHNINKAMKKHFKEDMRLEHKVAEISHIEKTPDAYKIIIDLKPFDNDEKNVEVKAEGDTITINAAGIRNGRRGEAIYKFMQNYSFDKNVNLSEMEKTKIGDSLVITLPIDD